MKTDAPRAIARQEIARACLVRGGLLPVQGVARPHRGTKIQLVVAGVLADPNEGPDSPLYEAFGYTRKSERKSGLTRKGTEPTPSRISVSVVSSQNDKGGRRV